MANCDNTSNDSGNLGVGPGVPNPNTDPEILRPEQNIPARENYKMGRNFSEPDNKAQKGIRSLGSFGVSRNKDENELTLPTDQRIKNEQEIQQATERKGKDEAEPQTPISSASKIDKKITQIKDSETKKSVDITSTETRPNKNLNEISISSDSKLKELNSIDIKSDSKKNEQEVLESGNRDIKIGDQIGLASNRQIKDSSITITGEKNFKKDKVVEDTNTHEKKDSPSMETNGANGNQVKVENDINAIAPVVNNKFFNEKDLNVIDIFKNPKKDETVNVHNSTKKKSESDLNPEEDHTLKFEMDIPSTISVNKTEEEIADTASTEKTEEEIADTTFTEKTEKEIADTTSTEKTEEEIADTTSTEKDLQEIVDTTSTEKNLQEIADTTSTEKDLQEIEEATTSQGKPTDVQITTEASNFVNVSPITILEAETGGKALSYNVNTPVSEQIIENDYDTTSVLRNKDIADNSASHADSEGNVTFIDENGNVNTTIRKIKDSTNTVSALTFAGFNLTTTNGEIDTELYDNAVKVLYEDNVLSSNYSTNNNANKNYEYELNTDIEADREIESNEGFLERETLKQETTTDTYSKIGDVSSDLDQRNERYDYTELENNGQIIKGSGDAVSARDFKSIDISSDGIINQELYPNDPVTIPASANAVDKNISSIYHENFIYDDFGNKRNTDVSSESNVGLFDNETPRKEAVDPTNQLDLERPNDQLQDRPEYVGDNNTSNNIKGVRDNKLDGITNENVIHSNYEASIKTDDAVLSAGEERENGQENTNKDYSDYISSRDVENDFIDIPAHEQDTPRKTVVPPNNIIDNIEPLNQSQDRTEYVGDDNINDGIKGVRNNKLNGVTNENITHSNYESEYKTNEVAQPNVVTTDNIVLGQDKSNFNYDSIQIERPHLKLSNSLTIDSESFINGVTQTNEKEIVYQDDNTEGYTEQVNVQDIFTATRLDRNVEYTLDDIDKTKLKIDATTVNSEGDITDIDFNNYNQQPGDFDDGNTNEYVPNRDAINYVIDDPATEDINETADAAIFQKQQVNNFDYTDVLVKSSGKISGTSNVKGAKDFKVIGASKMPGSIATTSNQKYADLLDTKNIDYGSAKVEEAFLAEFGLETIEEWKTQGVYLENVRNKIGEIDFNLYREDNNGDYSSVQETTNFTYSTVDSDGSEITVFNVKEGSVADKNSAFPSTATAEIDINLFDIKGFGHNNYELPNWTAGDEPISDSRDIDYNNAGITTGVILNAITTATGTTDAVNAVSGGISNFLDLMESASALSSNTKLSLNDEYLNVLRREATTTLPSIINNISRNSIIQGSDDVDFTVAQTVAALTADVQTVNNAFNHPAYWIAQKLREADVPDYDNELNVIVQGGTGNHESDFLSGLTKSATPFDIANSPSSVYDSFADYRNAVYANYFGKTGNRDVFGYGYEGNEFNDWQDIKSDLRLSLTAGNRDLNILTTDGVILNSIPTPTEYGVYNIYANRNDFNSIHADVINDAWNINTDRAEYRTRALTEKTFNGLLNVDIRQDIKIKILEDYATPVTVNGANIPLDNHFLTDQEINDFLLTTVTSSGGTGVPKFSIEFNDSGELLNDEWVDRVSRLKLKNNLFRNIYDGFVINGATDSGKITYEPDVDESDPHLIGVTASTRLNFSEGKDLFYKNIIVNDNDHNVGFKHFSWSPKIGHADEHNIFIGLNAVANNTIQPSDVNNSERMTISSIIRADEVNAYYDELMINKTNITMENYDQDAVANGELADPHLGDFKVIYNTDGIEQPIGIALQGKDLFARNVRAAGDIGAYHWTSNLDGFSLLTNLDDEARYLSSVYYDKNEPKNYLSTVKFSYRAKTKGPISSVRPKFDDARFWNDGKSNIINNIYELNDEGEQIGESTISVDFSNSNIDNLPVLSKVPTITRKDLYTTDQTDNTSGAMVSGSNGTKATSIYKNADNVPTPGAYSKKNKPLTITADNNYLLPKEGIKIADDDPDYNKFINTDLGIVRKTGEQNYGTDNNDTRLGPIKLEIKPEIFADKEVIDYNENDPSDGRITKTALHGAMAVFGAASNAGIDIDDNNTRFKAYDGTNTQIVYTDTQNILTEKKSDFHMKIKNKLDFFLKDNKKQTLKEKCVIKNYVDDLGYILVYPDSSKEYDINNNMLFTIPFQFNPELSGETRSAAWATHTAIGRTNEFLIWGNTSARSLQFKTTIAIIAPESGKDSKTESADISFKDTYNGSNWRMNPIYDGWGQSWNETNMYKVLNAYRGLVLPVDYSTDRADTSSNIISPPILSFTFGEDITQTRYSGVEEFVKSKWIATDVNIDARIEAGYTAKRNPRVYDITMTLKEVYGNFRSFQTHKQLIPSGGQ